MKRFEQQLAEHSSEWVRDGLITSEQRAALIARHPAEESHRFIAILGTIGGALVAAGIGLLIAANWQQLDDWIKIVGLVALLAGAHVTGWRLRISPGHFPKTGEVFFMIGCVLFLLGIALVSQIFHLNSRPASGVLLWWLGIAALPWIVRVKSAQCVSVVALLVWLAMELAAKDSWLRLSAAETWNSGELYAVAFFLLGSSLLFTGVALRRCAHAEFAGIHEKLGLLVANGALFALTFSWNKHLWNTTQAADVRLMPFGVFAALLLAAAAWAWRSNAADTARIAGWIGVGVVPALGFVVGLIGYGAAWWWGAAACVALFFLNVGMIRTGLATGRESWINLGVAFVALNIIARYI
ncbi:MAG TPA: DUF2157 domain-containing protein, partial [Opitutus sp.]|nr:DUF2157 domain-containing protein [Opitutus sp.]